MRHAILFTLLAASVVTFGLIEGGDFNTAGGAGPYFAYYLMNAIDNHAPLILLCVAAATVAAAGSVDLSTAAVAALAVALLSRFEGDGSFWWTALPAAGVLGLACGLVNGWAVGRPRGVGARAVLATLVLLAAYRGLAYAVFREPEGIAFPIGYGDLAEMPALPMIVFGTLALIGVAAWIGPWARRLAVLRGARRAESLDHFSHTAVRLGAFAVAGVVCAAAGIVHTADTLSPQVGALPGGGLLALAVVILAGHYRRDMRGRFTALFGAALLAAVIAEGCFSMELRWGGTLPFDLTHLVYPILILAAVPVYLLDRRR